MSALPRRVMPCSRDSCRAMARPAAGARPRTGLRAAPAAPATRFKCNDAARRRLAQAHWARPALAPPARPRGVGASRRRRGRGRQFRVVGRGEESQAPPVPPPGPGRGEGREPLARRPGLAAGGTGGGRCSPGAPAAPWCPRCRLVDGQVRAAAAPRLGLLTAGRFPGVEKRAGQGDPSLAERPPPPLPHPPGGHAAAEELSGGDPGSGTPRAQLTVKQVYPGSRCARCLPRGLSCAAESRELQVGRRPAGQGSPAGSTWVSSQPPTPLRGWQNSRCGSCTEALAVGRRPAWRLGQVAALLQALSSGSPPRTW